MIPCSSLLLRPLLIRCKKKYIVADVRRGKKGPSCIKKTLVHLALACKCPVPGLLDPLHHRACYLAKTFSKSFSKLTLTKFVVCCQSLSFFVNICLSLSVFVFFCKYFVFICQNLSLFVNSLSKSVFICLHLSIFVFMCLYLSFLSLCVFICLFCLYLSLFVKVCLGCPKNSHDSKSRNSMPSQPVNDYRGTGL